MEPVANTKKRPSSSLLLIAMILMTKGTKFLKVFKAAKFAKVFVTIVSMLISTIVYGFYLGPWFAVGLVSMLFIHEMGHVIAMRIKGLGTPAPVFIPFLGALIFAPGFKDRETEAFVGLGGPLLGTIGALACFALWPLTDGKTAEILLLVSYTGLFLNLFNLLPISPLDGGRVTQVVGPWFKWVGVGLLLIYTVLLREPGLLLIWLLVLDDFQTLPKYVRPVIALAVWGSMSMLMLMGYGGQATCINTLDIFLGGVFTWFYYDCDSKLGADEQDMVEEREYPPLRVRLTWLALYGVLAVTIVLAQIRQIDHLIPILQPEATPEAASQTP